jgi:hypothetical protein
MAHMKRRNPSPAGRRRVNSGGAGAQPATAGMQAGPTAKPTRRKHPSQFTVAVIVAVIGGASVIAAAVLTPLTAWLLPSSVSPSAPPSPTADTGSATPSPATPGVPTKAPSGQVASPQAPAGMTLQITPDHGGISTVFTVSGKGCLPGVNDLVDIYFGDRVSGYRVLYLAPTCQADHRYLMSYNLDENGRLTCVDISGTTRNNLTLSPGSVYSVQARATGDLVSPWVTYRVG